MPDTAQKVLYQNAEEVTLLVVCVLGQGSLSADMQAVRVTSPNYIHKTATNKDLSDFTVPQTSDKPGLAAPSQSVLPAYPTASASPSG